MLYCLVRELLKQGDIEVKTRCREAFMSKAKLFSIVMAAALVVSLNCVKKAEAIVLTLPSPTTYAVSEDMFYSYSATVLTQQGFPGFNFSTGSGANAAIFTFNGGPSHNNAAFGLPDPFNSPNNTASWTSTWGDSGTNAPITVSTLLTFLHTAGPQNNIPVFVFDFNSNGNLLINGQARILSKDPTTNVITPSDVVAQFSFDNTNFAAPGTDPTPGNNQFDPNSFVVIPHDVQFPFSGPPVSPYPLASSVGSGKADFLAYSPFMDLSLFPGTDFVDFLFNMAIDPLNPPNNGHVGGQELFISAAAAAPITPSVPEPGTMVLMGLGFFGAAVFGRRMKKSA